MNWSVTLQILGALCGIGGALVALLTVRANKRKIISQAKGIDADAATKLSAASLELLEPAREEIAEMKKRLREARTEVDALTAEVNTLRGQVSTLTKDLAESHDQIRRLTGE